MILQPNTTMIEFLEKHASDELEKLRRTIPEAFEFLHVSVQLNPELAARVPEAANNRTLTSAERTGALTLAGSYVKNAAPLMATLTAAIDRRMRNCNRAKLTGGVIAALAGVTLALLHGLKLSSDVASIASAAFSSVGGLLTVASGSFERTPNGARVSATDYEQLIKLRVELGEIQRGLDADAIFSMTDAEVIKIYERSVKVAGELERLSV